MYKKSKFNNTIKMNDGTVILHNPVKGSVLKINNQNYVDKYNNYPMIEIDDINYFEDLKKCGFIIKDQVDEDHMLEFLLRNERIHYDTTLVVTRNCNFECPYCYEGHENKVMEWETYEEILNYFKNIATYNSNIKSIISFFGGEPLLEVDNIIKFMEKVNKEIKPISPTINWVGHITTNAFTLDIETFKKLLNSGIKSFQITLDGLEKSHNKTRILKNGEGTWKKISENLLNMKEIKDYFTVQIRTNYTANMLSEIEEYLSYIKDNFRDPRFNIYLESAKDFNDTKNLNYVLDNDSQDEKIAYITKELGLTNHAYYNFIQMFGLNCYASSPKSLVVDYDGRIRKCTLQLDNNDDNNLGSFKNLDLNKLSKWTSYPILDDCKYCIALEVCYARKCPVIFKEGLIDSSYCQSIRNTYINAVKYIYGN